MNLENIIIPFLGMLGTAGIWQYLQYRLKIKSDNDRFQKENSSDTMYRDDLKNRVKNLESLLAQSSDEKDAMRSEIKQLVAEVNALRVEVEYLKKENERLKMK